MLSSSEDVTNRVAYRVSALHKLEKMRIAHIVRMPNYIAHTLPSTITHYVADLAGSTICQGDNFALVSEIPYDRVTCIAGGEARTCWTCLFHAKDVISSSLDERVWKKGFVHKENRKHTSPTCWRLALVCGHVRFELSVRIAALNDHTIPYTKHARSVTSLL